MDDVKPIYLYAQGQRRGPYKKAEIQAMWDGGQITKDTVYWHEGMAQWTPISGLFALVTCPACKREVSSEADRCPHCGQPIKRGLLGRAGTERVLNIGCLIILMIIAFFVLVGSCSGLFR